LKSTRNGDGVDLRGRPEMFEGVPLQKLIEIDPFEFYEHGTGRR
jgi:hypothetical protein